MNILVATFPRSLARSAVVFSEAGSKLAVWKVSLFSAYHIGFPTPVSSRTIESRLSRYESDHDVHSRETYISDAIVSPLRSFVLQFLSSWR